MYKESCARVFKAIIELLSVAGLFITISHSACFMEARVYRLKNKAAAKAILEEDRIKRFGYIQRDGQSLGVGDGDYIYLEADEETFEIIENSGAFERPENEGDVKKKIQEEQEAAIGGVSLLGM